MHKPGPSVREAVNRALLRLASNIGAPWGRDDFQMSQMADDWVLVLDGFSYHRIESAVSEWLLNSGKWPAPSDIRRLCLDQPAKTKPETSYRAEKTYKSPASLERAARIKAIQERHTVSVKDGVNWGAVLADPEYQQIYAEYLADGGRPVGAAA